jgi:hypothetical protein
MNKSTRDIFENLRGNWILNRTIEDLYLNKISTAIGVASFSQSDLDDINSLQYNETGKLLLKDTRKSINFTRKYIYKIVEDRIDIILDDGLTKGKLFQTLMFENDKNELKGSEHICKLDIHNGRYFFIDNINFYIEYTINGPKTNLLIKTDYSKKK